MIEAAELRNLRFGLINYTKPDNEAVMAITTISQLLSVPYKESAAGSNPREFQTMKSATNKKVLESFLKNRETFWALHSGISITVTGGKIRDGELEFEDACLTNGLQTITIARILTLIKAYQIYTGKDDIHTKINRNMEEKWFECLKETFSSDVAGQLASIKIEHVNSVLNWLHSQGNQEHLAIANTMTLQDIVNTKVCVRVVSLDALVTTSDNREWEIERLGDRIAEANNDTQKVKADDLFGTRYKPWLHDELFKDIPDLVKVEYRRFAEDRGDGNQTVVHVLDLLRAIIPTTLIVDSKSEDVASFVSSYANHREPVYNWFSKVISVHQSGINPSLNKAVNILRNLMPHLVEMRLLAYSLWDKQRKEISYNLVNGWQPLKETSLGAQVFDESKRYLKPDADAIVKNYLGFSFANVFPSFVFATRSAIVVTDELTISYELDEVTAKSVINRIYKDLSKERLKSTLGSTSNLFRNSNLYREAADWFKSICELKDLHYTDYTEQYRVKLD